jgi:hypothetical protein
MAKFPREQRAAYHALRHKAQVKAGETLLISAAGTLRRGRYLTRQSRRRSDRMKKAGRMRSVGADIPVNYKERDFVSESQNFTDVMG